MNLAILIKNQDEYIITRKFVKKLGIRLGYDEIGGKGGIVYFIDNKKKELKIGSIDDYKNHGTGYKFFKASNYFKKELRNIDKLYCCKKFRLNSQVNEMIHKKGRNIHFGWDVWTTKIDYCPFCGKNIKVIK